MEEKSHQNKFSERFKKRTSEELAALIGDHNYEDEARVAAAIELENRGESTPEHVAEKEKLSTKKEVFQEKHFDMNKYQNGFKYSYGVMGQYVKYNTSIYNKLSSEITDSSGNIIAPAIILDFGSAIDFFKYGVFGQVSKNFFKDKLLVSAGIRSDMNTFTDNGNNPLKTISPRVSFTYSRR